MSQQVMKIATMGQLHQFVGRTASNPADVFLAAQLLHGTQAARMNMGTPFDDGSPIAYRLFTKDWEPVASLLVWDGMAEGNAAGNHHI